jgi:hypothetical protein
VVGKTKCYPDVETTSCLNCDFFDFFDYYDTRLDLIKWYLSGRRQCVRYASAKKRVQSNLLRMTIVHKSKTSSVIQKIL